MNLLEESVAAILELGRGRGDRRGDRWEEVRQEGDEWEEGRERVGGGRTGEWEGDRRRGDGRGMGGRR